MCSRHATQSSPTFNFGSCCSRVETGWYILTHSKRYLAKDTSPHNLEPDHSKQQSIFNFILPHSFIVHGFWSEAGKCERETLASFLSRATKLLVIRKLCLVGVWLLKAGDALLRVVVFLIQDEVHTLTSQNSQAKHREGKNRPSLSFFEMLATVKPYRCWLKGSCWLHSSGVKVFSVELPTRRRRRWWCWDATTRSAGNSNWMMVLRNNISLLLEVNELVCPCGRRVQNYANYNPSRFTGKRRSTRSNSVSWTLAMTMQHSNRQRARKVF